MIYIFFISMNKMQLIQKEKKLNKINTQIIIIIYVTDQGGTPHARARVSLVGWEGRSHALLFMVPLGLPSARPMAQALRLPFEYYICNKNKDICTGKQTKTKSSQKVHMTSLKLNMK